MQSAAPGRMTRTPLAELLAARIRAEGPITFAEYMRECLYHLEHGYYNRPETRRFADYYTSVDVHPIFGRLLARQLAEVWELLGSPARFTAVEVGAGTGRLARHILDFTARALPEFHAVLEYVGIEQSVTRRGVLSQTLSDHVAAGKVRAATLLPATIPAGCIFSNEFFDALPVHRVVKSGELREIYVGLGRADSLEVGFSPGPGEPGRASARASRFSSGPGFNPAISQLPFFSSSGASAPEAFLEVLGPPSTPSLARYLAEQGIVLQEGQQAEVCLEACRFIEDCGNRLERGCVLTIDYGHEAAELYNARHMRGTLLAYTRHRAAEDFYAAPGEQDLTAHVNFTALELWGRRAGLTRAGLVSQAHFLLALGRGNDFADLYDEGQTDTDRFRARLLLKNLIHPESMGETFHVLVQHKGLSTAPRLTALSPL